jgi:hypothetical protein
MCSYQAEVSTLKPAAQFTYFLRQFRLKKAEIAPQVFL